MKCYDRRCSDSSYHLGSSKGFRSCESGTTEEEQVSIYYDNSQYHRYPTTDAIGSQEEERRDEHQGGREDFPEVMTLEVKEHWSAWNTNMTCWAHVKQS